MEWVCEKGQKTHSVLAQLLVFFEVDDKQWNDNNECNYPNVVWMDGASNYVIFQSLLDPE